MFDGFDAIERFIKIEAEQAPNHDSRQRYLQVMPIFQRCYHALCDVYGQLAHMGA